MGVNRFLEDIDLDFISNKGLDEKMSIIRDRAKEIKGFDVEGPRVLHRTLRFDCYYLNEFEQRDRIRLEFYLSQTEAVKTEEVLVKSPFIETHPVIFKVYSLEDLMARKNAYYIGNSTNHFIPRNLRPDWKVFIDTLLLKIERGLGG